MPDELNNVENLNNGAEKAEQNPNEENAVNERVQKLEAELEQAQKDHLYLRAEFDNYRKQAIKERSDLLKFGSERLLLEVLNILDNFERAIESGDQANVESYKKGVELTAAEMRSLLSRAGVQEVPSHNVPFDPTWHEALSSEECEDVPAGHIKHVFKKAYKIHDRVLRPGQVVVAKAKSQN